MSAEPQTITAVKEMVVATADMCNKVFALAEYRHDFQTDPFERARWASIQRDMPNMGEAELRILCRMIMPAWAAWAGTEGNCRKITAREVQVGDLICSKRLADVIEVSLTAGRVDIRFRMIDDRELMSVRLADTDYVQVVNRPQ